MTRFFSILFTFHYTFLVLSIAIFGLAMGGIYAKKKIDFINDKKRIQSRLPGYSVLFAITVLAETFILVKIGIFQRLVPAILLSILPFAIAGTFMSSVFHLYPNRSQIVYGFDLIGAAIGAIAVLLLLRLGTINAHIFIALVALLPSILLGRSSKRRSSIKPVYIGLVIAVSALFITNISTSFIGIVPFANVGNKQLSGLLESKVQDVEIRESRWSAFGRTDFVSGSDSSDLLGFYIDGVSGTSMYRFDGDFRKLADSALLNFPLSLPLSLLTKEELKRVLVIGPGGGRDILVSLSYGAQNITAVEVNRDLVDMMKDYGEINGGIYNDYPKVNIIIEEGRNFLKSTDEVYDIITLTLPVIQTSRSIEGFALTENYLFTVESISEYLDHLSPEGRLIVVVHNQAELMRLVVLSLTALEQRGISTVSAMKHLYTFGPLMMPAFVLKKKPIAIDEATTVHASAMALNWLSTIGYIPFIPQMEHATGQNGANKSILMFSPILYALSIGVVDTSTFVRDANLNVRAVTDDRPFFHHFAKILPKRVTIVLLFAFLLVLVSLVIGHKRRRLKPSFYNRIFASVFFLIGFGFMLFEVPVIQKLVLFLGSPTLSLSLVLAFLIGGMGVGSILSAKFVRIRAVRAVSLLLFTAALLFVGYNLILYKVLAAMMGQSFALRIAVTALFMVLLGMILGVPFPACMRYLSDYGLEHETSRMWSINAASSVLGSIFSLAVGLTVGFTYAFFAAAASYAAAGFILTRLIRGNRRIRSTIK